MSGKAKKKPLPKMPPALKAAWDRLLYDRDEGAPVFVFTTLIQEVRRLDAEIRELRKAK